MAFASRLLLDDRPESRCAVGEPHQVRRAVREAAGEEALDQSLVSNSMSRWN